MSSPELHDLSVFSTDPEMVSGFAFEAREHLVSIEEHMLLMAKDANDLNSVNAAFREIHSIKGLAGFFEFGGLQHAAHQIERLLDLARTRKLTITPGLAHHISQSIHTMRREIDLVEQSVAHSQDTDASTELLRATVPISIQFQKAAKLVRGLSHKLRKQVVLLTNGGEIEIDSYVAEEIWDCLLHMVRNSLDHGIETPSQRILAGKNPQAEIRLTACLHEAEIVLEISDDGRGLDYEKIRRKAIKLSLIGPQQTVSETELFLFIFEPGFSTALTVTDLSGRGVGMDVVKNHIEKLHGKIDIQSTFGHGTTFFLRLPL